MKMKHESYPIEEGFYWIINYKNEEDIVEIRKTQNGHLYVVGYGEDEIEEISQVWQRVKPYE